MAFIQCYLRLLVTSGESACRSQKCMRVKGLWVRRDAYIQRLHSVSILPQSYLRASETAHPNPARWIAGCNAPSLAEALDSLFQLPKIQPAEAHLVVGPGLSWVACDCRRCSCYCLVQ